MINTGDLIASSQIVDAVQNYYDWQNLYSSAKIFSIMNNIGMVDTSPGIPSDKNNRGGGKGNYQVLYNKTTGQKTDYTTTGAIAPASGALNFKTLDSTSRFDFSSALTFINVKQRAGLGFVLIGTVVDGDAVQKTVRATFRINTVNTATSDLTCQLLASTLNGVTNADACTSVITGAYVLLTEVADYAGAAPESDDMGTGQYSNYVQMFDSSFGKDLMALSQETKYDNQMEGLQAGMTPAFYSKIETSLMFGGKYAPSSTYNYGTMNGIWDILNLSDPTLNTDADKPTIKVENSTTFNYWTLYEIFCDRPAGAPETVLGFTTPYFGMLIEKAMKAEGETVRTEMVQFPRMSFQNRSMMIGDTKVNIITSEKMKYHPPLVDQTTATLIAKQEHALVCIDPRNAGLFYHENEVLGTMLPKVSNLDPVRGQRVKESHILAALTFGIWNRQYHVAYGITG